MKKEIHPKLNKVCFVDTSTGAQFKTRSTLKTQNKDVIDGEEYYIVNVLTSSASHPVYTGKKQVLDTEGRIDKFNKRYASRRKKAE